MLGNARTVLAGPPLLCQGRPDANAWLDAAYLTEASDVGGQGGRVWQAGRVASALSLALVVLAVQGEATRIVISGGDLARPWLRGPLAFPPAPSPWPQ